MLNSTNGLQVSLNRVLNSINVCVSMSIGQACTVIRLNNLDKAGCKIGLLHPRLYSLTFNNTCVLPALAIFIEQERQDPFAG
ncbi:hypothetical protein A4R26_21270 [Niastella populi]|uniref:Uncharacterized protein n=1 Tax=Niastella populi TaxID=550983 RepID=A0A1V9FM34_9BACT|nr:hypothetical protein A4R26_21270 [Niastella populi]